MEDYGPSVDGAGLFYQDFPTLRFRPRWKNRAPTSTRVADRIKRRPSNISRWFNRTDAGNTKVWADEAERWLDAHPPPPDNPWREVRSNGAPTRLVQEHERARLWLRDRRYRRGRSDPRDVQKHLFTMWSLARATPPARAGSVSATTSLMFRSPESRGRQLRGRRVAVRVRHSLPHPGHCAI